jgi:hypothetical protein
MDSATRDSVAIANWPNFRLQYSKRANKGVRNKIMAIFELNWLISVEAFSQKDTWYLYFILIYKNLRYIPAIRTGGRD